MHVYRASIGQCSYGAALLGRCGEVGLLRAVSLTLGVVGAALPLGSVTLGHTCQAGSTNARFDRLDIASGGRQRPAHFHPLVNTHPHTYTQLQYSVSLVVTT